jgi:hypothetical protein
MRSGFCRAGIASIGLALAACSSLENQPRVTADPNVAPANYKTEILAYVRAYLNDPTGIRGAFLSDPQLRQIDGVRRYASCLRFNAKKSSGEYEGSKDRVVFFLGGRLDTMVPAKPDHCAEVAFHPFPELERLTR